MMKSAAHDSFRVGVNQTLHAVEHGMRGFIGEGGQQNVFLWNASFQKTGNPIGQRSGLAASRSRQHQQRPALFHDHAILFQIQFFFIINH